MTTPLDVLEHSRYVLLTTFKRDGTAVATPVWAVRQGDDLLVWTNPEAGKVKRIRRSSRVLVAPCSMRGRPLGESVEGRGRVLSAAEAEQVFARVIDKYGWQARLTQLGERVGTIFGKPAQPRGALAVTVSD